MSNIDHIEVTCYRDDCHAVITLHRQDYDRLRESHASFYCPAGHAQRFAGKSASEKRIEALERSLASVREARAEGWRAHTRAFGVVDDLARALRVCPFGCGWTTRRQTVGFHTHRTEDREAAVGRYLDRCGRDLAAHLEAEHNATAEKVRLIPERAVTHG